MSTDLKVVVKKAISLCGLNPSYRLDFVNGLLKLGVWVRENKNMAYFDQRFELYAYINDQLLHNQPIEFLEFGVYKGDSLTEWLRINTHSQSRFWGFDSFRGLPEDWQRFTSTTSEGAFDLEGAVPNIPDGRLCLVKGYFQDTLPSFLEHRYSHDAHRRIIIHCDADLYSSTLFVLATMNRSLVPGTVLIFDEFSSVLHEFRAFSDFVTCFRRRARGLAAAGPFFSRVAVEIVE
jgi:O-methyltransferase